MPPSPGPKQSERPESPPWLRRAGGAGGSRAGGAGRRAAALLPFALLLFGGGVGLGFALARRHAPAVAVAPPPVCPPAPPVAACADGTAHAQGPHLLAAAHRPHRAAPKALVPLPEAKPMDDEQRTQALRTFAEQKAPELRDCLVEPERGPPLKLGAAFEIGANGAVDFVQILGADGSPKDVRRCYSNRLKRWRFPQALLRGEEKLLVNFVL